MWKAALNSGFTFVELLIVSSIMIVLSAASIPGFSSYIRDQNLKQSMEQVKSDLRTAQTRALAGSMSSGVDFWGIEFIHTGASYSNFTYNESSGFFDTLGSSDSLAGDVVVLNGNRKILFGKFTGNAYFEDENTLCDINTCRIVIGESGASGNNCSAISVNAAGGIFKDEGVTCP